MTDYSIWLLEYGRAINQHWSVVVHGEHNKGFLNDIPFCHLVMQSEEHTIMIDAGFKDAPEIRKTFGISQFVAPDIVLERVGIKTQDVDTILLTHAHYDHIGNIDAFSNAKFYLQRRELDEWKSWLSLPPEFQAISGCTYKEDIDKLDKLVHDERLILVDGLVNNIVPGIDLIPAFDTHTFGIQHVAITVQDEKWVFVGDNAYEYENIEGINGDEIIRPVGYLSGSIANSIMMLAEVKKLVNNNINRIIINHAPSVFNRYDHIKFDDGLRLAELHLAKGQASRIRS